MPSEFPAHRSLTLPRRRRGRLPVEAKEAALAEMHRLLAEGLSRGQIAEALGLSVKTIGRWVSPRSEGLVSTDAPGQLLPVRLAAGPDVADGHAHPVLLTPAGHRVMGLSLEQLAALLRMLG